MSRACSISTGKAFGVARMCREGAFPASRAIRAVTGLHSRHRRRQGGAPTRPTPMRSCSPKSPQESAFAVHWRGLTQGLGPAALPRHPLPANAACGG